LGWLLSPAGSGTDFEVRISRAAQFAGGAQVFTNPAIRLLLQDNRGSVLIPAGVSYQFANASPYEIWRAQHFTPTELTNAAISGDGADPDADRIANLVEYAFNLDPRVLSQPLVPRAFIQNLSGQDYLHIQYTRRNPPADVQYLLQNSSDLFALQTNPANFTEVSTSDNGDGTSLVTVRLLAPLSSAMQSFVRIAIQR
jgi:hypothetical protein